MDGIAGPARTIGPLRWRFPLLLCGMVLLWTVLCAVSHTAPDLDGMEELVWATSFELGYYKHPPLPSWVLYALVSVVGRPVWLVFFAGQLFSALALWFVFLLGCEFTTPRRALIATLMVSTTAYFSLRGTIYNHNTVQLWSVAAATWLLYRALRYQKPASWLWLGAVSALSTMTKYSIFIQFAVFFCFMLRQGHFREAATLRGLAYALGVYLLVLAPHVYWLASHDFAPLRYADGSIEASSYLAVWKDMLDFVLDQLGRLSPMLIVWLALAYWSRRTRAGAGRHAPAGLAFRPVTPAYAAELSAWDRSFLLWVGLGPFVITVLVSALLGTRLVASWATTFFILYGYFALWGLWGDERINLRRTVYVVIAVHVLMAAGYALGRGPLAYHAGRTARSTFPGAAISARMQEIWARHVPGQPLRLVASDTWFGGNIAVHAGRHTQVFIDASYGESPWLDPARALDCGVLVAWSPTTRGTPVPALVRLHDSGRWHGVTTLRWSSPSSPLIEIHWAIVPPTERCPPVQVLAP